MKLTINLKLQPSPGQYVLLLQALERANTACDAISTTAWQTRTFGQYALHKATYYAIKAQYGLSAQMTVRCIAKVADAYKLDRKTRRTFRPHGSIAYDERILRFTPGDQVSLWTLGGRQTIPFVCGDYQRRFLPKRQGEVGLVFLRGTFYLSCACSVAEPPAQEATDMLGVDLGIVNIATDSDGTVHSGQRSNITAVSLRIADAICNTQARKRPHASCGRLPVAKPVFKKTSTTASPRPW